MWVVTHYEIAETGHPGPMQRFHVLDGQGQWRTGVQAFVELWSHLPYYRRLAALIQTLRLDRPLEFLYRQWVRWRLRRRCGYTQCGLHHE